MRTALFTLGLSTLLISCETTTEQDYENISRDMCNCMSTFTKDLSETMTNIIIEADGDQAVLQTKMMEYMGSNLEEGMKDVEILSKAESPEIVQCIEGLQKKYDHLYTNLSEEEILDKMSETLGKTEGCEVTLALMKIGLAAQQ